MRNGATLVAVLAIVTGLLPTHAAGQRLLPNPVMLRMEGFVGPPPKGRREVADLTLGVARQRIQFQVTNATVLSGGTTARNVFRQVRPHRPNFTLQGASELIATVANAAPAARLRMVGTWRPGSRQLLLSSVEALPSDATPASAEQPAHP